MQCHIDKISYIFDEFNESEGKHIEWKSIC
jgi:hypothetical protein